MENQAMGRVARGAYEWAEAAAFAVVCVVLVFTFLFRVMGVDGASMEPTLHHGDYLIVSSLFYEPKGGDIVVLAPTQSFDVPVVKRVIATQGQTVDINFTTGDVTVDGAVLDEPYIAQRTRVSHDVRFPLTVPEGCIFLLGDNRNESLDSRASSFGTVDTHYVLGRAVWRVLPFRSFGAVE